MAPVAGDYCAGGLDIANRQPELLASFPKPGTDGVRRMTHHKREKLMQHAGTATRPGGIQPKGRLLGRYFPALGFAFLAHELQGALGFLVSGGDFLLDLGGGFLQLR